MTSALRRGCLLLPASALGRDASALLERHQHAEGKGRDPTTFDVWLRLNEGILVPRYSPLVSYAPQAVDGEPSGCGEPDAHLSWNPELPMRPEQLAGAAEALRTLRAERGCLIRGDTGSGKTVVGMRMMYELQPRSTLILVDQRDIAKQWGERIRTFMPSTRISFLMPEAERRRLTKEIGPPVGAPSVGGVLIATAQSLRQSTRFLPDAPLPVDMLICDEVHVFGAPSFVEALFRVNYRYALGLTATDDRKDGLDWVFRQFVGFTVVPFAGRVMRPSVRALTAPDCGIREEDWYMAFCRRWKGMTWADHCSTCRYYAAFPHECGGDLKTTPTGVPIWDGYLNRSGMVSAWCNHPSYLDWLTALIDRLAEKRRNMFVFGDSRTFLIELFRRAVRTHGADRVGIFLGQGRKDDEPDLREQRADALRKQVTFVTYGVARKALDVPEKDTAVLATPISDARQVAGRVRRVAPGKVEPVVVVPVVPTIPSFWRSWQKIRKQFTEEQWSVTD